MYLIYRYYSKDEFKVLLCFAVMITVMILHYFLIANMFDVIFFLKEYLQLVSLAYICYFFLYQMYKLIQGHICLTYFGLAMIILTVLYLSAIAIYFTVDFYVVSYSIYDCSNQFWIYLRVAGFVLSLLFLSIGVVISKSLKKVKIQYTLEVRTKENDLW
jgi:hypothetical protein